LAACASGTDLRRDEAKSQTRPDCQIGVRGSPSAPCRPSLIGRSCAVRALDEPGEMHDTRHGECVAGPACLSEGEWKVAESYDPIALELFKNAIFSIADEMALTVFRTTYSGVLKDNMDYSTGFAD